MSSSKHTYWNNKKRRGLWFAATLGGLAFGITAIATPFVTPAFRRIPLPYVPATSAQIKNIFGALSNFHKPMKVPLRLLDLGSGDGRIVLAAVDVGYRAHGVDLNWPLVIWSKLTALRKGLRAQATFARQNLFICNFSDFDSIVIFGVPALMSALELKFESELSYETLVVACRFPLPTWQPICTVGEGIDTVWLYKKPRNFAVKSCSI